MNELSNTSGASVANIGFWSKALLQKALEGIQGVLANVQKIIAEDAQPAAVDFSQRNGGDKISDEVMEEIARRLIVTFEQGSEQQNVEFSVNPPADKSKFWWQIDPTSGVPIGVPKEWDEAAGAWVPISSTDIPAPQKRYSSIYVPAGDSEVNFEFPDIGTVEYDVFLTPTTKQGTLWVAPPASIPDNWGWIVKNKTNIMTSISFYEQPTGGLTWDVVIVERQTAA